MRPGPAGKRIEANRHRRSRSWSSQARHSAIKDSLEPSVPALQGMLSPPEPSDAGYVKYLLLSSLVPPRKTDVWEDSSHGTAPARTLLAAAEGQATTTKVSGEVRRTLPFAKEAALGSGASTTLRVDQ